MKKKLQVDHFPKSEYSHYYPLTLRNLYPNYGKAGPYIVHGVRVFVAFYKTISEFEKGFSA